MVVAVAVVVVVVVAMVTVVVVIKIVVGIVIVVLIELCSELMICVVNFVSLAGIVHELLEPTGLVAIVLTNVILSELLTTSGLDRVNMTPKAMINTARIARKRNRRMIIMRRLLLLE